MHAPTLLVASVAVLSTFAIAEPQRPKFYFPRQIKRQVYYNSTITVATQQTTQERLTTSSSSSSSSTKRDLGDVLDKITGQQDSTSDSGPSTPGPAAGTGGLYDGIFDPIKPTPSKPNPGDVPIETPKPDPGTGFVGFLTSSSLPVPPAPTGSTPEFVIKPPPPPPSTDKPPPKSSSDKPKSDSSSSTEGITFGPGGIVTSDKTSTSSETKSPKGESKSDSGDDIITLTEISASATPIPTASGIVPSLGSVISSVFIPALTSSAAGTTETAPPTSTHAASTSSVEPTTALPTVADVTSRTGSGTSTSVPEGTGSTFLPIETSSAKPTVSTTQTTSLGSILSSILSTASSNSGPATTSVSVLDPSPTLTTDPALNTTNPDVPTVTSTGLTTPTGISTTSGSIATSGPHPTETTSSGPITSGTVTTNPPATISTDTPKATSIPNTDLPITTSIPVTGTDVTNSLPTATGSATNTISGTSVIPVTTYPAVPQTSSASTSGSIDTTLPMTTYAPQSPSREPQTIAPASTNTDTSMWLPGNIIAAPTLTTSSGQPRPPKPTGIAPTLPKVITNPNITQPPEDTTLIQIGFLFQLNYKFIVDNPKSSAQIFMYLPQGIADGLGLKRSQVIMQNLIPLDTTQTLQYITTLALAYIPTNMVSTLALDLHTPTSAIYNNDDASINELMNYINPAIPLTPGSNMETGGGPPGGLGGSEPPNKPASGNGNSVFGGDTNEQSQTPGKTGATAGIAMAAIGGTVAYGAAMFLIARRYKKKKQSHRRSSSMTPGDMRQSGSPALMGGGAFMSGGRTTPGNDRNSRGSGRTGNSARTQQISAPMMAENSLGWN
ncbi:hypothetical protein WAI453_003398 [Rhynchosporium graminicola]